MNITHAQLVDIAHRLILKKFSCGVAYKETVTYATSEIPDVIGFGGWGHSVLIECKVSRADFKRNAKKQHKSPMGRYRFFCAPEDMINIHELPPGWGLMEINEKGKLANLYNPFNYFLGGPPSIPKEQRYGPHETCWQIERNFMYSILRRK